MPPSFSRRRALQGLVAGAATLAGTAGWALPSTAEAALDQLRPLTTGVPPIAPAEYQARIERARALMRANGIDALLIEPGSSMVYFAGVQWHRSERLTALLLPIRGAPVVVTPFFEEPSVRQTLAVPADVRVWQEDEDPLALVAGALRERGLATATIGIEESVRFFASNGLAQRLPQARLVSANPVVRGCRLLKSPAELALMRVANAVTLAALRWAWPQVREGMTPAQVGALIDAATVRLGGDPDFALVLVGAAAALPHGSHAPQTVREGEVVLMDCGCRVQGYSSDISRTGVPGRMPPAVREVWELVAAGQQVALQAAKPGTPAGAVDDAVRGFYTRHGFGPGYRLPGLSHRTGHGIGLDGHEPVNLVHGETTPLAPGMCFSDEPGLYLPGRFGVRLEDCWHMTANGPELFTVPPTSPDQPIG